MPTYEYACKNCEEHLEVVQSFKDEPLTECPNCGGQLRKVFGNIGIAFKGSGFYKTDSRAASSGGGAKKDGAASGGGAESSGTSSSSSSTPSSTPSTPSSSSSSSSSSTAASA